MSQHGDASIWGVDEFAWMNELRSIGVDWATIKDMVSSIYPDITPASVPKEFHGLKKKLIQSHKIDPTTLEPINHPSDTDQPLPTSDDNAADTHPPSPTSADNAADTDQPLPTSGENATDTDGHQGEVVEEIYAAAIDQIAEALDTLRNDMLKAYKGVMSERDGLRREVVALKKERTGSQQEPA